MSRMRRPETVKLDITSGDWLLVKKHLTAGETRRMYGRLMKPAHMGDKQLALDPLESGLSMVLEYLLDWSITGLDDKTVVIRDKPVDVLKAALDNLDPESFVEIREAVEAHHEAMEQERAAEKNAQDGAIKSSAISPSAA